MAITALPTAGRFPVRRKRPNRPAVDNASRRPWCPCNGVRFIYLKFATEDLRNVALEIPGLAEEEQL
jgi:hypothetical protein